MVKTFKAADKKKHTVMKKGKKVVVKHGDGSKINLTKKSGAKTVAQGVKASKKYHSKNK